MKIKRISWRNFRSLKDGEIVADGHNVLISGRNGVGKSSIASIVPFVLFGRVASKGFDKSGITLAQQLPEAEVEFVDGRKFRRAVTTDNKNHLYIDGRDVSASTFNAQIYNLTGGAGNVLFDLFEFPNMRWKDQRDFLLANFTTAETLTSPDEIRGNIKRFTTELAELDARLKEIYDQLHDMPDKNLSEVDSEIAELETERAALQDVRKVDNCNLELARKTASDLGNRLQRLTDRHKTLLACREELLAKWRNVNTTCPTCGAKLKPEAVTKARDDIVALGRKTVAEATQIKNQLVELQAQLEAARNEVARLERESKANFDTQTPARLITIGNRLNKLREIRVQIQQRQKLETRIIENGKRRQKVRDELGTLEGELMTVNSHRQQLIRKKESDVNSQFQFVTFKLFKILSTNGETRETCEAMIDGVPYANLSKGERFKAACDILNTLQNKFGCEMPLMIDDAESYTSNSLVKLPNQLFLFKVTDDDLRIEVQP